MSAACAMALGGAARLDAVKRIAGYANAVTAMLEVYEIVPAAEQVEVLAMSERLAHDIAKDLASLVGDPS